MHSNYILQKKNIQYSKTILNIFYINVKIMISISLPNILMPHTNPYIPPPFLQLCSFPFVTIKLSSNTLFLRVFSERKKWWIMIKNSTKKHYQNFSILIVFLIYINFLILSL